MTSAAAPSFYVTGGNLPPDAPSYVERQADRDLYEALIRGEFCYVLHSRQMGKSSLMVRTAVRLRQEGVAVAVLDLTGIGQNLSPEQWYHGLRELLGEPLELEAELEAFWEAHSRLGPLQRFLAALRQVVLAQVPGRVVIFVEEVDAVRSLPFSADEFFAGIRECYNRRSEDPEYARLTFCLLGVATPSDLIQDVRTTPFNIGRRIELTDFTEAEALPLAAGLIGGKDFTTETRRHGEKHTEEHAQKMLRRVLDRTGGHPYLTQRLCRAIVEANATEAGPAASAPCLRASSEAGGESASLRAVDALCEELLLSPQARRSDDNLLFVRDRLLRSEADPAALLDLYGQVRRGKRVRDDDTNHRIGLLRLSGISRVVGGQLAVRNRIYHRVFDEEWVTAHMPDAELRRQRAAYRKGLLRATALFGIVLAVVGGLAFTAANQARRAQAGQRALRRTLYAADMDVAHHAWEAGNVERARELLEAHRPARSGEELRGFEWFYLWRLTRGDDRLAFRGHANLITSVAFFPDGRRVASGSFDDTVRLWDVVRQQAAGTLPLPADLRSMALSPEGRLLAAGLGDGTLMLWDVAARRPVATRTAHGRNIRGVAFSPDGRLLATASGDGWLKLWRVPACREVAGFRLSDGRQPGDVAFAPDGKRVAIVALDGSITLWDVATRRVETAFQGFAPGTWSWAVLFSCDGRSLVSGSVSGLLRVWDLAAAGSRPRLAADVKAHAGDISGLAFSPDGKHLASSSRDNLVKLWGFVPARERQAAGRSGTALPTLRLVETLRGHTGGVGRVAFSRDGRSLVTGGLDKVVRLWDAVPRRRAESLKGPGSGVYAAALSADGRLLAAGSPGGAVRIWELSASGERSEERETFKAHEGSINSLAFSPDGKRLATSATEDPTVKLWEVAARRGAPLGSHAPRKLGGHPGEAGAVVFSPRGETLAVVSNERIHLWDVAGNREPIVLKAPRAFPGALALSPGSGLLASAAGGGTDVYTVWLWHLVRAARGAPRVQRVTVLRGHDGHLLCLAFSPDGRLLASGSRDRTVRLWDVSGKRPPRILRHQGWVNAVAFSADGKTLASSANFTVKLWNLTTGREVATLKGHTREIDRLGFSADGNTLMSGSMDGTVRLWRAASFAQVDAAEDARPASPSR